MLIQQALDNPQLYFAVIITVVISIVLHELAHGWAAISRGDRTPIELGHMTGNPLVHMGGFSLVMLFIFGIAWGAMPVDPSRMRGKYADAFVSIAGPAMNLLLAIFAIALLGLLYRFGILGNPADDSQVKENLTVLLRVFGIWNLVLMLFNLLPVPPLDGSRILGDFVPAYRDFMDSEAGRGVAMAMFIFLFLVAGRVIFPFAIEVHARLVELIAV